MVQSTAGSTTTLIKSSSWINFLRLLFVLYFFYALGASIYLYSQVWQLLANPEPAVLTTLQNWNLNASVYASLILSGFVLNLLIFLAVAILMIVFRYYDRIGLLVAFTLVGLGLSFSSDLFFVKILLQDPLNNFLYVSVTFIAWFFFPVVLATFPSGTIVIRWLWFLLPVHVLQVVAWFSAQAFPSSSLAWLGAINPLLVLITYGSAVLSQILRYFYHSSSLEKQQIKFFLFGMMVSVSLAIVLLIIDAWVQATYPLEIAIPINNLIGVLAELNISSFPIMLTLTIFRYRIWEVDIVVNRSLVYISLALVVLAFFFVALLGLQILIGQQQPLIALAIAGGFSFAIFNPLRKRVQYLVDRYIYGLRIGLGELDKFKRADVRPEIKRAGLLTGQRLGNYDVLDLLGSGGMGDVYKAADGQNQVALKFLQSEKIADSEILRRFQREAETGMTLKHPNIAQVYSLELHEGMVYMVMQYFEGQDLSEYLKNLGALDVETTLELALNLLSALELAHENGIVHRDIKPSNVMIVTKADNEHLDAILMDFGIAKLKAAQTLTGTGAIGTIDYMSPEQIMNAKTVDHRADIYGFGVMLYEILTGERPFSGGTGQVLFAHLQQPAPDPRDKLPSMPRPLAKAIIKALEKDPNDRFQSAKEMALALSEEH